MHTDCDHEFSSFSQDWRKGGGVWRERSVRERGGKRGREGETETERGAETETDVDRETETDDLFI